MGPLGSHDDDTLQGSMRPGASASHRGVALHPGATIGRYAVLRLLGAGGMGVVVEARDPELGRNVALKVLHDAMASARACARLRDEARALARLNHPNVVAIHDVGEDGGRLYIAMELIDGRTL